MSEPTEPGETGDSETTDATSQAAPVEQAAQTATVAQTASTDPATIDLTTADKTTEDWTTAASPLPPPPNGQPMPAGGSRQWGPVDPPVPAPPRVPTPLSPRWLVAAAAAAVMADVALRRAPWNNVAGAMLIAVLALGLVVSGFLNTRGSRIMVSGAVIFGLFLAIRTEPILTTFNFLAAISLLILGAIHGQGRTFWNLRPLRLITDAAVVFFEGINGLVEVPAEVGARYRVAKEKAESRDGSSFYAVVRGLAIAVPVVLLLGLLLASADAVFSSFFSGIGTGNLGAAFGHLFLMAIGAYAMMVLLRLAHTQGADDPDVSGPSLGHIETMVILGSVNLLFGAFAVAQMMTVLGGAEDALSRAGLDPKQFARQGFFQLLWVASLTLGLLMVLHALGAKQTAGRKVNRFLALLTVALTLLIVVVAFTRIAFYIGDGGQTPLRLYSAIFCVWVGFAFLAMAVRLWGVGSDMAWLLPVLVVSGLVTLGGINLANPERVIALDNIERNHEALYWHVVAGQFTGDGQAVLAEEMDRLSADLGDRVTEELCLQYVGADDGFGPSGYEYQSGWLNFNLGQWRAEQSVTQLCDG